MKLFQVFMWMLVIAKFFTSEKMQNITPQKSTWIVLAPFFEGTKKESAGWVVAAL